MLVIFLHLGIDCTATAPLKSIECCDKKSNKCGENEGDCDTDNDCKAGLKCGTKNAKNCPSGFPSYYYCCYKPLALGNLFLLFQHCYSPFF